MKVLLTKEEMDFITKHEELYNDFLGALRTATKICGWLKIEIWKEDQYNECKLAKWLQGVYESMSNGGESNESDTD